MAAKHWPAGISSMVRLTSGYRLPKRSMRRLEEFPSFHPAQSYPERFCILVIADTFSEGFQQALVMSPHDARPSSTCLRQPNPASVALEQLHLQKLLELNDVATYRGFLDLMALPPALGCHDPWPRRHRSVTGVRCPSASCLLHFADIVAEHVYSSAIQSDLSLGMSRGQTDPWASVPARPGVEEGRGGMEASCRRTLQLPRPDVRIEAAFCFAQQARERRRRQSAPGR